MSRKHNVYFVVSANARTEAGAVAEAADLARGHGNPMGVSVRRCGTKRLIAKVLPDGTVLAERK